MATVIESDGAETYETRGGVKVRRLRREVGYADAIDSYISKLDERRGAVFSSNYEYPGRYTRWDTAIVDPPVGISCFGRKVWIEAYNERGEVLLSFVSEKLKTVEDIVLGAATTRRIDLTVSDHQRRAAAVRDALDDALEVRRDLAAVVRDGSGRDNETGAGDVGRRGRAG